MGGVAKIIIYSYYNTSKNYAIHKNGMYLVHGVSLIFHLDCTLGVGPLSTIATVCCMKMYHAFVCKLLPRPTDKWEGLPSDSWISSFRHCTVELASVCTFQVRPLAKHTDTSIGQIWPDCSSKINTHRGTSIHRGVKWVPGKCSQSSCFHNIESNAWLCYQKL